MRQRSGYLANRGHSFGVRQALLCANQVSIGGAQLGGGKVYFPHQLVIQSADLIQQLLTLARWCRNFKASPKEVRDVSHKKAQETQNHLGS